MLRERITGDVVITCFIIVQLMDWVATCHGVILFGTSIESNPLLRFMMERYDIILVLTVVKILATMAGSLLHFVRRHMAVALLTLFYLLFAIFPWLQALPL
jgi:hypothetical protein